MFITCQECNTTFRLDERLLKPTGSKVRCSQCLHTFIAMPPILQTRPVTMSPALETAAAPGLRSSAAGQAQEHELEGIDLAELDAMLEGGAVSKKDIADAFGAVSEDKSPDLGNLDLNLDFETALETEISEKTPAALESEDNFDLSMDFEIEDGGTDSNAATFLNLE
jgi:pilus assembly protein FimV